MNRTKRVYTSIKKTLRDKSGDITRDVSLIGMILIVMTVSLVLVALSYYMYLTSDQRKYDLARPGTNRSRVLDVEEESTDVSSPITSTDIDKKLESIDKELQALKGYNTFGPEDLSDQNLGLTARDQLSP